MSHEKSAPTPPCVSRARVYSGDVLTNRHYSLLAAIAATASANGGSTLVTAGSPARLLAAGLVVVVARQPGPGRARTRTRYAVTGAGRAALEGRSAPARIPFADLRAAYRGFGLLPGYCTRRDERHGTPQDRTFAASVRTAWAHVTSMLAAGLDPQS